MPHKGSFTLANYEAKTDYESVHDSVRSCLGFCGNVLGCL